MRPPSNFCASATKSGKATSLRDGSVSLSLAASSLSGHKTRHVRLLPNHALQFARSMPLKIERFCHLRIITSENVAALPQFRKPEVEGSPNTGFRNPISSMNEMAEFFDALTVLACSLTDGEIRRELIFVGWTTSTTPASRSPVRCPVARGSPQPLICHLYFVLVFAVIALTMLDPNPTQFH